jgi:hypothetical protein
MQKTKFLLTGLLVWILFSMGFAQDAPQGFKYNNHFDLALSFGGGQFTAAPSWTHLHGIGKKQKFKIGYGTRLNLAFGSNQSFVTAPAKLTSGKTGLGVLFSDNIPANIDTVSLVKSQVNSLNAMVVLQYTIVPKLDLGFNIDVIGFSFGGTQGGTYSRNGTNTAVSAKPTGFNLLLTSDNDLGSLNSEFYVRYWFNPKWALRAGFTFIFSEYTTSTAVQQLPEANDRFRNKVGQAMIALTFSPFRK